MFSIISVLMPIFGIMCLGAFAERRHLLPPETAKCLNQFVYWFGLPMLLFSVMAHIRLEHMSWSVVLAGSMGLLVSQGFVTIVLRFGKLPWKEATMGGMVSSFPNVAFMGIPLIVLLYPTSTDAKVVAGIMAILPTINLVFTDIALTLLGKETQGLTQLLKNVCRGICTNPSLIGATLGACVGLMAFPMPNAVMEMAHMVGNTASPCALFCIGMSISSQLATLGRRKQNTQEIDEKLAPPRTQAKTYLHLSMLLGKLFLCPILMYGCCMLFGVEGISLAVMTIMAAMPTAVVCHIIASKHEVISDACTNAIIIGTLLSLPSLACVIFMVQGLLVH